jgi:hypothetical protein
MPLSANQAIRGCSRFTIPNTVFIDYGWKNLGDNFPSSAIGQWTVVVGLLSQDYKDLGFNVVATDIGHYSSTITAHLQSSHIYMYKFVGHGNGAGAINGNEDVSPPTIGITAARYTQYGIFDLALYACSSAERWSVVGQYVYNPWEQNVATRGFFTGFDTEVDGFDWSSHRVQTPGTNSR